MAAPIKPSLAGRGREDGSRSTAPEWLFLRQRATRPALAGQAARADRDPSLQDTIESTIDFSTPEKLDDDFLQLIKGLDTS